MGPGGISDGKGQIVVYIKIINAEYQVRPYAARRDLRIASLRRVVLEARSTRVWRMTMKRKPAKNIDEYVARCPKEVQWLLMQMRRTIRRAAPQATERISYGIPTFFLNGNLVHFAAFKKHMGFYPTPSGIAAFQQELSPYKWSKGAVQFPMHKRLPLDLVSRMVKFRVIEQRSKSRK
jgi:uncharacterized protein YdhG (YjbR/CyaY superfamily)